MDYSGCPGTAASGVPEEVSENIPTASPQGPSWQRRLIGVAVLVIVLTIGTCLTFQCYLKPVPAGQALTGRLDYYLYYGPLSFFLDHEIHNGEFPLWNPLYNCGEPFAGLAQVGLFYPPNLIRSLLVFRPTPYRTNLSMAIMAAIHFVFMGVCTYYCARCHNISIPGACVASVSFCFSYIIVRRWVEFHFVTATAWLPLLIILEKAAIDAEGFRNRIKRILIMAFVLGLCILSGFIQILQFVGMVLMVYGCVYTLTKCASQSHPRYWVWIKETAKSMTSLIAAAVIAALLALPMLLPAWELAQFTPRLAGHSGFSYSNSQSWTLLRLFQSIIMCGGMDFEAETIRGAGVAALVLGCLGLTSANRQRVWLFAILFAVCLECSFGPPLPCASLLKWATPFTISAYTRAYDFALFPASMLAGLGVDALTDSRRSVSQVLGRASILIYGGLVTLIPLAKWTCPRPFIPEPWVVTTIPAVAIVISIAALLIGWKRMSFFLAFTLSGLVFMETLAWNSRCVPNISMRSARDVPVDKQGDLTFPIDNTRDTDPVSNRLLLSMRMAMNGYDAMWIKDVHNLMSGISLEKSFTGYLKDWEVTYDNQRGNLFLKRSFWLARQYVIGALPGKREVFPSATTVFLRAARGTQNIPLPQAKVSKCVGDSISQHSVTNNLAGENQMFEILTAPAKRTRLIKFTLPTCIPGKPRGPARTVHSALSLHYVSTCAARIETWLEEPNERRSTHAKCYTVPATGGQDRMIQIPLPDYATVSAGVTVVLKEKTGTFQFTQAYTRSDQDDEDYLLKITERGANSVALEVGPLPSHRILTFLDAYYPGWKAYINDQPVEILRADDQFKAIVVPPGVSRVRFTYVSGRVYCGVVISLVTLVTMAFAYVALNRGCRVRQTAA